MSFRNTTFKHYFIGYADLDGKGNVVVEHYWAKSYFDCMKQCLTAHDIHIHPTVNTVTQLREIAAHNNKLVSTPRKVEVTII